MKKIMFAVVAAALSTVASAGSQVASGVTQSVSGSVVTLPGALEPGSTIVLPNRLNPTQIRNIATQYGVPYTQGRPLMVLAVQIRDGAGRLIAADLLIGGNGQATLELASEAGAPRNCS